MVGERPNVSARLGRVRTKYLLMCMVLLAGSAGQSSAKTSQMTVHLYSKASALRNRVSRLYSFEQFMHDSVYDPDFGYYNSGRVNIIGSGDDEGDFWTHATLMRPCFGSMLADRIQQMWVSLSRPSPFFVFEFGAGQT